MIRTACAVAAFLALILLGSPGGHMLFVEHVRCAEHGELVHGDSAHHHPHAEQSGDEPGSWRAASSETVEDAHEHCALCAHRRDMLIVGGEPRAESQVEIARHISVCADQTSAPGDRPLRVAPKTSPPA